MEYIIETKNLTKRFPSKQDSQEVVSQLNLTIRPGIIYGFLGPNGAGKTTTLKMLTTLLAPDSGEIYIAGLDYKTQSHKIRQAIGYVSQAGGADPNATGEENLLLQGRLYGLSSKQTKVRMQTLIDNFNLTTLSKRIVKTYSGGERRRLDIALALLHNPSVLFLDEPSLGLDIESRIALWNILEKIKKSGTTIFLTSHYLEEVDRLADEISIIHSGKIIAEGTPTELKDHVAGDLIHITLSEELANTALLDELQAFAKLYQVTQKKTNILCRANRGSKSMIDVMRFFDQKNLPIQQLTISAPSLNDVFLQKIGTSFSTKNEEVLDESIT